MGTSLPLIALCVSEWCRKNDAVDKPAGCVRERERESELCRVTGEKGLCCQYLLWLLSLPLASSDTTESQGVSQGVCLYSPELYYVALQQITRRNVHSCPPLCLLLEILRAPSADTVQMARGPSPRSDKRNGRDYSAFLATRAAVLKPVSGTCP